MQPSHKELFTALAILAAGTLAFTVVLYFVEGDSDGHPLGMLEWVIGGLLIGPGIGYLLQWRRKYPHNRPAVPPHDPS